MRRANGFLKTAQALERRAFGKRSLRASMYAFFTSVQIYDVEATIMYRKAASRYLQAGAPISAAICYERSGDISVNIAERAKSPVLSIDSRFLGLQSYIEAHLLYMDRDTFASDRAYDKAKACQTKLGLPRPSLFYEQLAAKRYLQLVTSFRED
jgi:hypothetical protein